MTREIKLNFDSLSEIVNNLDSNNSIKSRLSEIDEKIEKVETIFEPQKGRVIDEFRDILTTLKKLTAFTSETVEIMAEDIENYADVMNDITSVENETNFCIFTEESKDLDKKIKTITTKLVGFNSVERKIINKVSRVWDDILFGDLVKEEYQEIKKNITNTLEEIKPEFNEMKSVGEITRDEAKKIDKVFEQDRYLTKRSQLFSIAEVKRQHLNKVKQQRDMVWSKSAAVIYGNDGTDVSKSQLIDPELLAMYSTKDKLDPQKVIEKFGITDPILRLQIEELARKGKLDNFLCNYHKQLELMGKEAFNADPKRLIWLINNPEVRITDIQTNIEPEEYRFLASELVYKSFLLGEFDKDSYEKTINTFKLRYGYKIKGAINPKTGEKPWQINKKGLQGMVMEVKGEYVVIFEGSQSDAMSELKLDWGINNGLNTVTGQTPYQQEIAADFVDEVKEQAEIESKNINVTGHSLAGGAAEYVGSKYNINAITFDPAPAKVNSEYSKVASFIPAQFGLLNHVKQDKDGYNRTRFNTEITGMILPEAIDNEFIEWLNKISNYTSPAGLLANNIEYCDEPSNYESVYHNSSSGGEIIMGRHNNLNIDKGTEYMFTPYEIKEQDEK